MTSYDHHDHSHSFNHSLLICLGKKPSGSDEIHGNIFTPDATRPLNIVNTDNRIIANAARLRWEDTINEWISPQQQGFLRSRSILQNLMDIDLASMLTALGKSKGCTILFDFSSAFPSISQKYLIELFSELGIPESAINFVKALYHENFCDISFKGDRYPGFTLTSGVRQGCPLSPLLYAICAEVHTTGRPRSSKNL